MEEGGFGDDNGDVTTEVVPRDVLAWESVGVGVMDGGGRIERGQ